MKKKLLSAAVLGVLVLASCSKIKDAVFPSFETSTGEVRVPVPIVANTLSEIELASAAVQFNVDSVVKKYTANQFSIDNAGAINVQNATIDVLNGDALNNFSNFEYLKLAVSSDAMPQPVVVAETTIAGDARPIVLPGNNVDLKPYLKSSRVTYSLRGKARKPTTKPLEFSISVQLRIN